jgi:hypothetical protein
MSPNLCSVIRLTVQPFGPLRIVPPGAARGMRKNRYLCNGLSKLFSVCSVISVCSVFSLRSELQNPMAQVEIFC